MGLEGRIVVELWEENMCPYEERCFVDWVLEDDRDLVMTLEDGDSYQNLFITINELIQLWLIDFKNWNEEKAGKVARKVEKVVKKLLSGEKDEKSAKKSNRDLKGKIIIELWEEGTSPYDEMPLKWQLRNDRDLFMAVEDTDSYENLFFIIHQLIEGWLEGYKKWEHKKAHRYAKYVEDVARRLSMSSM